MYRFTNVLVMFVLVVGAGRADATPIAAGSLYAWGANRTGQINVPPGDDYVAVAGGYEFSLALKTDGSIVGWGRKASGESIPPSGNDFVEIAAGSYHAIARRADGSAVAWGSHGVGQVDVPPGARFIDVDAGLSFSVGILEDGSLAAWGTNKYGQTNVPAGNDFVAVSSGWYHSIALRSDGSLAAWGRNNHGQLNIPPGNDFTAIAAKSFHNLALKADGSIVAWGRNYSGESNAPPGNDFVAISAGAWHSLALKSDGSLAAWGSPGNGKNQVPPGNDFVAIAAGGNHNIVIRAAPEPPTFTWDGNGAGNWGEARWVGNVSALFPDESTRAVVKTDTVTVAENRAARSLTVQSGAVQIAPGKTLAVSENVAVAAGGEIDVAGILQADAITADGSVAIAPRGRVIGDVLVGGVLAAESPGTLYLSGDLEMRDGSTYRWPLGETGTPRVLVSGNLTLGAFTVELSDAGGTATAGDRFELFRYFGAGAMDSEKITIDASQVDPSRWDAAAARIVAEGRSVYVTGLNVAAVPEPSGIVLAAMGFLGLCFFAGRPGRRQRVTILFPFFRGGVSMNGQFRSVAFRMQRQLAGILCLAGVWLLWPKTVVGLPPEAPLWTTFQGNSSHTGYMPVSLDPDSFSLRWERSFGRRLNPVTAGDGKVYVSEPGRFDPGAGLFALDAATGATLWTTTFGRVNSVNPPAFADGKVYIQTGKEGSSSTQPYLQAFDADSGTLVFRSLFSAQWEKYYAPTIYDGNVYVNGGYYGGAYGFDGSDGTQLWFHDLPQYDEWTPAVDQDNVYTYVGDALYVLDRASGEQTFKISDPNFDWHGWSMQLAPVLGEADDVLVIRDGRLISFDLERRSIRWEKPRNFSGQPSLADGVIYAINAGALTAWDEATGDYLWAWAPPAGKSLTDTMIVTDTHVIAGTTDTVYAVDLSSRDDVWSYPAGGHLALSEGTLYIAGNDGDLIAVNAVPEPSALVLAVIGFLAIVALARRRRR